jgi:hypothetical protein
MTSSPVCVLTGYQDSSIEFIRGPNHPIIEYIFLPVGRVRIERPAYDSFLSNGNTKHPDLAGICRNAFENDEDPPLISAQFLQEGIRNIIVPKEFREKAYHLLNFLYFHGGKEYKKYVLHSHIDYTLCYCNDEDEFERVVSFLEDKNFVTYKLFDPSGKYTDFRLTEMGLSEVEKGLPDIPMIALVTQQITTGDDKVDAQINHAMYLFFNDPRSMERMRSACETLSYVLEPLKNDLKGFFLDKDVRDFFRLVNEFDIRHNKENTKQTLFGEQLEWIFYTLLNTINAYVKLKNKLGNEKSTRKS